MTDGDLDRMWQSAASTPASSRDVASGIASRIAADLKPVRPLPSAAFNAAVLTAIVIALSALGAWAGGGHAAGRMNPAEALFTFVSLAASVGLLASALSAQMVPASRRLAPPWALAAAILIGLALIFLALFPYRHERHFWNHALICFRGGTIASAIAGLPIWIVLRRGAILHPRSCGALAGLLGGLVGTSILEMDCSDFNVLHILVAHWGVPLLCAAAGWLAGGIAARR